MPLQTSLSSFNLQVTESSLNKVINQSPVLSSIPSMLALLSSGLALQGFPGGSVVKNPPASAGDAEDTSSISGLGRSPGVGNGNPL